MSGVTKPVMSVSSLCESGVEVRFNKQLFLNSDEDCAPLFKMVSATSRVNAIQEERSQWRS